MQLTDVYLIDNNRAISGFGQDLLMISMHCCFVLFLTGLKIRKDNKKNKEYHQTYHSAFLLISPSVFDSELYITQLLLVGTIPAEK